MGTCPAAEGKITQPTTPKSRKLTLDAASVSQHYLVPGAVMADPITGCDCAGKVWQLLIHRSACEASTSVPVAMRPRSSRSVRGLGWHGWPTPDSADERALSSGLCR
jgi:hypothetical protein